VQSICVFCGSSIGALDVYRDDARRMGESIAQRGLRLVYGGGKVGLMGVVADAALQAGGEVLGIIPEALMLKEVGHGSLTNLVVTRTMHERKAAMADAADAFVALPGGFGTFDELCEILTWGQLGIHQKPIGLLDTAGFFRNSQRSSTSWSSKGSCDQSTGPSCWKAPSPTCYWTSLLPGNPGMSPSGRTSRRGSRRDLSRASPTASGKKPGQRGLEILSPAASDE
jgi:uncharacterized protein (TIGR00730 family)